MNTKWLSVALALLASGTAVAQDAPRVERPVLAAAGTSWVNTIRDSGSFGSGERQATTRSRGEQTWSGRKVHAYEGADTTLLVDPASGAFVARTRGDTVVERWNPPLGLTFPLSVGKSWVHRFAYSTPQASSQVEAWFKVEAYEEVKVAAGTFRVFRISYSDGFLEGMNWWSADLGINVKLRLQRNARHSAGPGIRETELLSQDIRK